MQYYKLKSIYIGLKNLFFREKVRVVKHSPSRLVVWLLQWIFCKVDHLHTRKINSQWLVKTGTIRIRRNWFSKTYTNIVCLGKTHFNTNMNRLSSNSLRLFWNKKYMEPHCRRVTIRQSKKTYSPWSVSTTIYIWIQLWKKRGFFLVKWTVYVTRTQDLPPMCKANKTEHHGIQNINSQVQSGAADDWNWHRPQPTFRLRAIRTTNPIYIYICQWFLW